MIQKNQDDRFLLDLSIDAESALQPVFKENEIFRSLYVDEHPAKLSIRGFNFSKWNASNIRKKGIVRQM